MEIHPVIPSHPVIKPAKIKREQDSPEKKQPQKQADEQETPKDSGSVQHIDEIV